MAGTLTNILGFLRPERLIGPVLSKEMHESSRRKRFYALRLAYLATLILFTALSWSAATSDLAGGLASARMADAGKQIIGRIAWFQFIAAQVVGVVIMSASISGEVSRRTLPVLMTTPLSHFRIAAGKLLGGSLHVATLLLCSLPLLAVVRVFGGVPWNFVLSSLAVTFCSVLAVGAISMYFSIRFRQPYAAILFSLLAWGVGNSVLLLFTAVSVAQATRGYGGSSAAATLSPFSMMYLLDVWLRIPVGKMSAALTLAHCAGMLALCLLLVRLCARRMKWITYDLPAGETELRGRRYDVHASVAALARLGAGAAGAPPGKSPPRPRSQVFFSQITGSPILWRDTRRPIFANRHLRTFGFLLPASVLIVAYLFSFLFGFDSLAVHASWACIGVVLGAFLTAVAAASTVSSEREARTWPILFTTPLSCGQILAAKFLGVLRRCGLLWLILLAHLCLFTILLRIAPTAVLHMILLVAWLNLFICGLAFYLSSRMRSASMTVLATLAVLAIVWFVLPKILATAPTLAKYAPSAFRPAVAAADGLGVILNPVLQTYRSVGMSPGAIMDDGGRQLTWPEADPVRFTWLVFDSFAVYSAAAVLLVWRASRRLRKHLFN
jgi:ABC-type transport system involved in multi-copper enzyme maturation permease subunit